MKRPAIIGISVALILAMAGAGGWWHAQRQAEKQVRRAMIETDLIGRLTYDGVSYNPLSDTVTVRDVRPIGYDIPGQPRAGAIEILDWDREEELLTRAHIKVVDFRMDVLEAVRQQFNNDPAVLAVGFRDQPSKILENPLQALIVLGYQDLIANAEVDYRYDPAKGLARLTVSLTADRMGEVRFDLALAGITPKLVRALMKMADQATAAETPLAVLEALGPLSDLGAEIQKISLSDLGQCYEDFGLIRRVKHFYNLHTLRLPNEPSQLELSNDDIEGFVALSRPLGLPEDRVRASAQAVVNFSKNPQRLCLRTRIDDPVRLTRLPAGDDPRSISGFVLLTNMEITD